jgi:tyrosine-specific transport protein
MLLFNNKTIGAVFLVIGTSIGAGMLGIPLATAKLGFKVTILLFTLVFFLMMYSAIAYAKVSIKFSANTNLDSYLNNVGNKYLNILIKFINVIFLYALITAYAQGMSKSILAVLNQETGGVFIAIPKIVFFTLAALITFNTKSVDVINRIISSILILSYMFMLYSFFSKDISVLNKTAGYSYNDIVSSIPLLITSFGFHLSIPSIKDYLQQDEKKLIKAIIYGLTITFVIYCLWIFVIFNSIDTSSAIGVEDLLKIKNNYLLAFAVGIFSLTAILSSFLGVGLGLKDFFYDITKNRFNILNFRKVIAGIITFLPPIIFLAIFDTGFVHVLKFAGTFAIILLIIMPIYLAIKLKVKMPLLNSMMLMSILILLITY